MFDIKEIVESIDLIHDHNILIISDDHPVKCSCIKNSPASLPEIQKVAKDHDLIFSDSLSNFWQLCNGITFGNYGGTRIYSIGETAEFCKVYEDYLKPGFYIVGVFDGETIAISSKNPENLLFGDILNSENFHSLNVNFTDFLRRIIQTGGIRYWDWAPTDKSIINIGVD